MTDETLTPGRQAYKLTRILNAVYGAERFPVDVTQVAKDYSKDLWPEDPISVVKGASLPGFEGMLQKAPVGKRGWGIFFNTDIRSPGRINFTLAHEFGHYLLHRQAYPEGIECEQAGLVRWESEYGQIEHQANVFAANLLMPLDDFRQRIGDDDKPGIAELGDCGNRYNVSLIAAALRWIDYTRRRACLVLSRDGFVLWARSSKRAHKTGVYIKTVGLPPVPVPASALANRYHELDQGRGAETHDAGVWFPEECDELVLYSDQYDFTISLLHFGSAPADFTANESSIKRDSSRYTRQ